jgi:hypothetical protein
MMEALVGMITKHLKKGERVKIAGWEVCKCGVVLLAWAAIRRPGDRRCLGHASITNTVG